MPRLVPELPVEERKVYLAVHNSLDTPSFHAYKSGLPVHGDGLGEHTPEQLKAMKETAVLAIYQATKPTPYSDENPLCCVLNVWTEDISLSSPEDIKAQYHLCGDTTKLGINITPQGSFIDLHCDIGRSGYSMVYGQCEKVFVLAPPTQKNLELFATTAGLPNRLARIGDQLEGCLVVPINRSLAIDLPSCAVGEGVPP